MERRTSARIADADAPNTNRSVTNGIRSLFVCYVSGLDQRRVSPATTPFLAKQLSDCPWRSFTNLPSNELFPTLVTGVDPTVHGVWGVQLKPPSKPTFLNRLVDGLPDVITTTVQGIRHVLPGVFDLAAIPPRRRRRLAITRTKYKRRSSWPEALFEIGGSPSVFSVIGSQKCRYRFSSALDPQRRLLRQVGEGRFQLEILELYSLDRFQQWNLDRLDTVLSYYRRIDDFLRSLHAKCQMNRIALMIISDHGHEPIRESVDLLTGLRQLPLPEDSYSYFMEVSNVRFWFHDEEARQAITRFLSEMSNGRLVEFGDMHRFGVPLKDDSFGELFFYLDPGNIFFPHDFHHPLANFALGLADPMQRSRLRDPRHKGNHGHLPEFEAENAFLAVLQGGVEARAGSASILDVAPSILALLGYDQPPSMTGRPVFQRAQA